jgi:hypothetical protein
VPKFVNSNFDMPINFAEQERRGGGANGDKITSAILWLRDDTENRFSELSRTN